MRLRGIEASRGIAALIVVASHATRMLSGQHPLGDFFRFGHAGVEFFFVLSGFIIAHVHGGDAGHPERLGHYASRRLTRVYPTYWAVFVLYAALLAVSPSRTGEERHLWTVLGSVLLLPSRTEPVVGVAWTLHHELLFYALFAVTLLHRRVGMALLGAWGVAVLWTIAVALGESSIPVRSVVANLVLSPYNLCFFFGLAVAVLIRRRVMALWRVALVAGITLFLATALQEWLTLAPPHWSVRSLCFGAASGLVVYGVAAGELRGALRLAGWANIAGALSYPLYLSHVLVLMLAMAALKWLGWLGALPPTLTLAGLVAGAVVFAYIFHQAIERPLLRWCRVVFAVRKAEVVRP